MFCSKCGKEIPGNVKFCTFCGEKNDAVVKGKEKKNHITLGKCFEVIAAIISLIAAIGFVRIAYLCFEGNQFAFDWCDSDIQLLGRCLHWGICILFCVESITFVNLLRTKASKFLPLKYGAWVIMQAILLEVLGKTFSDWKGTDKSLALYRVFHLTYSQIVGFTVFMGVLLVACGIVVVVGDREEN